MQRMAAESRLDYVAGMADICAEDARGGRPGRQPSLSEDDGEHPLVK